MANDCPNCGAPNKEGHRFCSVCGSPLTPTGSVQAPEERAGWTSAPVVPPNTSPTQAIPPPPPSYTGRPPQRETPPVELDRKGEATYAPYSEGAVRQLEKGKKGRSWLLPAILAASILLVVLVGATIYLFFSPNKVNLRTGGAGAPTGPCPLSSEPSEEDRVKNVVCVSNEEQIKAWKELNTEILRGTRTGKYLDENVKLVEDMKQQQIYGEPVNLVLDILDVRINDDRATVLTSEVWTVTFRRLSDNSKVDKRGPDMYRETYHMVKMDGKWLIEDVEFVHVSPTATTAP